jgi:hypothetical protein
MTGKERRMSGSNMGDRPIKHRPSIATILARKIQYVCINFKPNFKETQAIACPVLQGLTSHFMNVSS